MHPIEKKLGFPGGQLRSRNSTISKRITVLVIPAVLLFIPGLIFAQNESEQDAGDKAVEGFAMVGIGAGATALGVYILDQSDPPDCSGTSYTTDPQTGKSPREVCEEERNKEQENAQAGAAFVLSFEGTVGLPLRKRDKHDALRYRSPQRSAIIPA